MHLLNTCRLTILQLIQLKALKVVISVYLKRSSIVGFRVLKYFTLVNYVKQILLISNRSFWLLESTCIESKLLLS